MSPHMQANAPIEMPTEKHLLIQTDVQLDKAKIPHLQTLQAQVAILIKVVTCPPQFFYHI